MTQLSKEQFKFLQKYEDILRSAYYSHTVIGARIDQLRELMDLYVELGYRKQSITCNFCVINFLSTLGSLYFTRQNELVEEEIKKVRDEAMNEPEPEVDIEKEAEKYVEGTVEEPVEQPAEEPIEETPAEPKEEQKEEQKEEKKTTKKK